RLFSDRIAAALLAINIVLLALALFYTPAVVSLLAPGLDQDPARYTLAVTLTRITFPSLLLVSLQTMISGELNANGRLAGAAGARRGRAVLWYCGAGRRGGPPLWVPKGGLCRGGGRAKRGGGAGGHGGLRPRGPRLRPEIPRAAPRPARAQFSRGVGSRHYR